MTGSAKVAFFDELADSWDGFEDLEIVGARLTAGLDEIGVGPDEAVLDVGCGTGNLTRALLARLSAKGRVVAIDISSAMVRKAREKIDDPRVTWHVADAMRPPVEDGSIDRVICFSVWPHLDDPASVARELHRILRPSGIVHIWHTSSRSTINEVHAAAGEAVSGDVLVPAVEVGGLLEGNGFAPREIVDDESRYLVTAVRLPANG